jgi:hypothetical protein
MVRSIASLVFVVLVAVHALAPAQQPRPYDGIQAGLDAYRLGEERRRSDFQQQLDLNSDLRAWSGLPRLSGETMWYQNALRPSLDGNLDAMYGYGYGSPTAYNRFGYGDSGTSYGGGIYTGGPPTVFEPWPYVPGDIWGYNYFTPWRQPVGRWEGQTGPNRWESHPIYDPPITPYRASPPVESSLLDRTPYAAPQPRVYEWSADDAGRPDTVNSPRRAASEALAEDVTPSPPAPAGDLFDRPRGERSSPPITSPPIKKPRVREF